MNLAAILFFALLSSAEAYFGAIHEQIIGGNKAEKCEFPSAASIKFHTSETTYLCGGVLIDDKHLLTSASCFHPNVRKVVVRLGIERLDQRVITRQGRLVTPHNDFDMVNLHNDIAMVTLDRRVRVTKCVKPIMLPEPDQSYDHRICVSAGWGQTSATSKYSNDLMKMYLPIVPVDTCAKKIFTVKFAKEQICGGRFVEGSASNCLGDQGGPLLCPDGQGNQVLAGIASFNYDCQVGVSIFTNISRYLDWIKKQREASDEITRRNG